MIQALPTPGGLSRLVDILLPGGGFEAAQNGVTYFNAVDVAWSGAPGTPDVASDGWTVQGLSGGKPLLKHPTLNQYAWFDVPNNRYKISGAIGSDTPERWTKPVGSGADPTGTFFAAGSATGTLTVTPDLTSGVHSFVPTGGYTGGGSIWTFDMPQEPNGAVFAPDWFGRNHGVVSGTSYPNKVNVSGATTPAIAADGWQAIGLTNGKPHYYKSIDGQDWFAWNYSGNNYAISRALSSIGSPALWWAAASINNGTLNPQGTATGTATVTADTTSGTYLFAPAGLAMAQPGGPTVCGQPLPVGVFDGVSGTLIDTGFNPNSIKGNCSLMALVKPVATPNGIALGTQAPATTRLYIGKISSTWSFGVAGSSWSTSSASVTLNEWVMLCATVSGTNATLYVNGQPVQSKTGLSWSGAITGNLYIGANNNATQNNWNGPIALAAVAPVPWPEDKIRRDWEAMNRTPPRYFHSRASGGCKPLRGVDPNLGGQLIHSLGEVQ
jgi:hypothetical protein